MNYSIRTLILIVFLAGFAAISAFGGAVELNATCEFGNCANPGRITDGNSVADSFSFAYTTGSDTYDLSGTIDASYGAGGTVFTTDMMVDYVGSGPSVSNDSFTVDVLQDFFTAGPGTWDGTYTESVPVTVGGTVGAGTSVSSNLFWSTPFGSMDAVGVIGPFSGTGSFYGYQSANLTGLTGDTLAGDFRFSFDFGAGTETGAGDAITGAPEPAETLPVAVLLLLGGVMISRHRVVTGC